MELESGVVLFGNWRLNLNCKKKKKTVEIPSGHSIHIWILPQMAFFIVSRGNSRVGNNVQNSEKLENFRFLKRIRNN